MLCHSKSIEKESRAELCCREAEKNLSFEIVGGHVRKKATPKSLFSKKLRVLSKISSSQNRKNLRSHIRKPCTVLKFFVYFY